MPDSRTEMTFMEAVRTQSPMGPVLQRLFRPAGFQINHDPSELEAALTLRSASPCGIQQPFVTEGVSLSRQDDLEDGPAAVPWPGTGPATVSLRDCCNNGEAKPAAAAFPRAGPFCPPEAIEHVGEVSR